MPRSQDSPSRSAILRDALWVKWRGRAAVEAAQRARLAALVEVARARSPFYRRLYRGLPDRIEDLAALPVTTKAELMESFDDWGDRQGSHARARRSLHGRPRPCGPAVPGPLHGRRHLRNHRRADHRGDGRACDRRDGRSAAARARELARRLRRREDGSRPRPDGQPERGRRALHDRRVGQPGRAAPEDDEAVLGVRAAARAGGRAERLAPSDPQRLREPDQPAGRRAGGGPAAYRPSADRQLGRGPDATRGRAGRRRLRREAPQHLRRGRVPVHRPQLRARLDPPQQRLGGAGAGGRRPPPRPTRESSRAARC